VIDVLRPQQGIDFRAFAGYLITAFVVAGLGGGLYGAGVVGAPAVYGAMLLACAVARFGFLRWEERDHRSRH
jgi:hypothetical protein